jgi:hypothetical protein
MSELRLITLAELADRLRFDGRDRARSVRRCFRRHGLELLDGKATEALYQELLWRMQGCSASADAAGFTTAAVRSASAGKCATSKSALRAAVNERLRTPTRTGSRRKSETRSFTVLPGGRGA